MYKDAHGNELQSGQLYEVDGETVEFSRIGGTGLAIVHPPGEPDMQSSWAVEPSHLHRLKLSECGARRKS